MAHLEAISPAARQNLLAALTELEGKILEIDREKGEITIQRTKDEKEILLDCSKESVMEDITLNSYNTGDQIRYYFWPYEASEDRIKVEELFKSTIEGIF